MVSSLGGEQFGWWVVSSLGGEQFGWFLTLRFGNLRLVILDSQACELSEWCLNIFPQP